MPVVELSLSRLQSLVGKKANKKQILDSLPFLGLDIESLDGNIVRVEYSPNRPDYSTDFGIALGLQGILGISKKKRNSFLINDVIEKPEINEAPSNYAIIGRYILPTKILSSPTI